MFTIHCEKNMITIKIWIIGIIAVIALLLNTTSLKSLNEILFIILPTAVFFTTISSFANAISIEYSLLKSLISTLFFDVSAIKCTPAISKSISRSTFSVPSLNSNAGILSIIKFFHPPTLILNPATSIP